MLIGFGWCHLLTSREELRGAEGMLLDELDEQIQSADEVLWKNYRVWMSEHASDFLKWQLIEYSNSEVGLVTYSVVRNHRSSAVWDMLEWIAENGGGSYGLFYCHDNEDSGDSERFRSGNIKTYGSWLQRKSSDNYRDVFRVHRLWKGQIEEMYDPFFGHINLETGPELPEKFG